MGSIIPYLIYKVKRNYFTPVISETVTKVTKLNRNFLLESFEN